MFIDGYLQVRVYTYQLIEVEVYDTKHQTAVWSSKQVHMTEDYI
jgi:hypothetical protein